MEGWSTQAVTLPSAVGIEVNGEEMLIVLKRGTPLPVTGSCRVTTTADYQTDGDVQVFYGDCRLTKDNTLVDGIRLTGIPSGKKGEVGLKLILTVDAEGQVTLRAKEVPSKMVWKDSTFRGRIRK